MDVKLTAQFFFKQGKFSKVEWLEKNPRVVQKNEESGEVEREIPLTAEEVKSEYLRMFMKHKNEGKAVILHGTDKVGHLIDLGDVRNVEIVAEKVEEEAEEVTDSEN